MQLKLESAAFCISLPALFNKQFSKDRSYFKNIVIIGIKIHINRKISLNEQQ